MVDNHRMSESLYAVLGETPIPAAARNGIVSTDSTVQSYAVETLDRDHCGGVLLSHHRG
jgi:hypothetical protein